MTLSPRTTPRLEDFFSRPQQIHELIAAFGSPLNVVFPEQVADNFNEFSTLLKERHLTSRIFFAHKSNSSSAILKRLALEADANIDVASENELSHALTCGFNGKRLEATGPKSSPFLYLCVQHGVTINIDSVEELRRLNGICDQIDARASVLLRLSGFTSESRATHAKDSRFGIPIGKITPVLEELAIKSSRLDFKGFSFHIDTADLSEKAVAIVRALKLIERATDLGLRPSVLNIGGGFKMRHFKNPNEWSEYSQKLKDSVLGRGFQTSWNNTGFGVRSENDRLRGALENFGDTTGEAGAAYLDALLGTFVQDLGGTIGDSLLDLMVELWIEPGCSLLDECGITLASVRGISESAKGEVLIGLAMKRSDISFVDKEFFTDPLLITSDNGTNLKGPKEGAYLSGNLCLESDLIFRHKYFPELLPKSGDILAFSNTAGYLMDFSAARSIMHPVGEKIAVETDGGFRWFRDTTYIPYPARTHQS